MDFGGGKKEARMGKLFYTPGEVAQILRVATKTIYRLLLLGEIPGSFKFAGSWRIDREIFHDWLKKQATSKWQVRESSTGDRHNLLTS